MGCDHANLEGVKAILAGRLPAFYVQYDANWRTFNARLVGEHRRGSLTESIDSAEASHRALLAVVQAVPADEFGKDHGVRSPAGRRVTIDMLLRAEATDERKHARLLLVVSSTEILAGVAAYTTTRAR